MLRTVLDSALPMPWLPAGVRPADACTCVVGGDTDHPWTYRDVMRVPCRWRIPVWAGPVFEGPGGQLDGRLCLRGLDAWGVPRGVVVVLDMGDRVDAPYVLAFARAMRPEYRVIVRGDARTVRANPACDGYWYAGVPGSGQTNGRAVIATQYAAAGAYDLSVVTARVRLWDARRPARGARLRRTLRLALGPTLSTPSKNPVIPHPRKGI